MIIKSDKDPIGKAVFDYHFHRLTGNNINVYSSIAEKDIIPVEHFFRKIRKMPVIEQKALELCFGKVLDVGAGAGCHSLILQQKFFNVTSLEISQLACNVMHDIALQRVVNTDFFEFDAEKYDTLLFLMNGIGIAGKIDNLTIFFNQCKKLLNKNGIVLLDSSDIIYMFKDDNDNMEIEWEGSYYGEVKYIMEYNETRSDEFDWLFIDFKLLEKLAGENGFKCELIMRDDHFGYLAKLTLL